MATVLVVEDEPDLRDLVCLLLGVEGFDVLEAGTGEAALPLVPTADAVLLDIRLPGISGLEVVEQLPTDDRSRVLFMSAHQDMERRDVAGEYGCAGFVVKPFDFDDLFARVRKLVAA